MTSTIPLTSRQEQTARVILERCVKRFTTQRDVKLFVDKICNHILGRQSDLEKDHPETLLVAEAIREAYEYTVVPEVYSGNTVFNKRLRAENLYPQITNWIQERLANIAVGINQDFIMELSGEAYESKSVKKQSMVIISSVNQLERMTETVIFDRENRSVLEGENVHAIRKQLHMAGKGALAVCKDPVTGKFETVGLIAEKDVPSYRRFVFQRYMEWDFCIPTKAGAKEENDCRVHFFHGNWMMPVVSLKPELIDQVKKYVKDERKTAIISQIILAANKCNTGSILIFADQSIIKSETEVLIKNNKRGILLNKPIKLDEDTDAVLEQLVNIDGALLIDLEGNCYACGVILDGALERPSAGAPSSGSPARGSRYNSSCLYVESLQKYYTEQTCFGVIRSEDGMLDIVP